MSTAFSRRLTLLRKEQNLSQKHAAADLSLSQALLSHYEKGIREPGLAFIIRTADYYGVSCDYLLGRSAERQGAILELDSLSGEDVSKVTGKSSVALAMNRSLITNSIGVLFHFLDKSANKTFTQEVSAFIMLAIYRMFRVVYSVNPKNNQQLFSLHKAVANQTAAANMMTAEAKAAAIGSNAAVPGLPRIKDVDAMEMTTETISEQFPQLSLSLFNLIKFCEDRLENKK